MTLVLTSVLQDECRQAVGWDPEGGRTADCRALLHAQPFGELLLARGL
jgi:hypothetical protein